MGLFSSFFGGIKYSQVEHSLTEIEIKKLVSRIHINTLKQEEEGLVEEAIIARRHGDGKISLQQIYEVLTQLKNQHKISLQDREGLMRVFGGHFNN
ncbi:MAG: hypothetical protein HY980_03225 [Candidatus Magasanikbacteria bacterium]|nr:hypothetical protein [Candidatus Magasanikbacteria bacterium]